MRWLALATSSAGSELDAGSQASESLGAWPGRNEPWWRPLAARATQPNSQSQDLKCKPSPIQPSTFPAVKASP